ncbi:MAG: LptF/LptG family permease [Candidatus Omnitrophica bacterium]|nr:LptF/LptG family permease [Candidatus Omnitrophota bacterium]MBU2044302.1 LptF/LptG family permease [Candidatus Omnitrophota bacterium]MBU2473319.1 LptF/LptG family permease [Candidatus Omnitrophota bacterium]
MKIIRNYILKDFFSVFIFSFLILSSVLLMGKLIDVSDMIVRKGINIGDAFKLLSFAFPPLLRYTLPLSFFMGVLLSMGRLIADNEIIAMRVAGVSTFKILHIFILIGVIFALLLFILNDKVIPGLTYRYHSVKKILMKNISAFIEPGVFLEHFENHVIYVSDKQENKLKNVIIYMLGEDKKATTMIVAKQGEFIVEGDILKMKLEDVYYHDIDPAGKRDVRGNFKIFFKNIPIEKEKEARVEKKPSDMEMKELLAKINQFKQRGIDARDFVTELNERINLSFSIFAFSILGFGVSLIVRHREKSINFGIACLGALTYYLLYILGKALIERQIVGPIVGTWLSNVIVLLLGSFLIYKHANSR